MGAGRCWLTLAWLGLLLAARPGLALGKMFSRCELVHALKRHGFPEQDMRNWVCLVESESSGDTAVVGGPNTDGSHDFGLFQINDRYWCGNYYPGGECHVRCQDLTTDDISTAVSCVRKIYSVHGFWAWYGWVRKCHWQALPDISNC